MPERVGFIGLGDIGLPVARRVLTHGYQVTVCGHRRPEPVQEMQKLGAVAVELPREVAKASDVVITMVRDDNDTATIMFGPDGILEGSRKGSGIILMSTLSPSLCRRIGETASARNVNVIDAPVTGTRLRATTGELGIMVGGPKELLERYRPILETMGKVVHCGELGTGQIVKLANNMALMINIQGAYEAVAWAMKNGADERTLVELMKIGTADSWVVQNWEFVKSMNVNPPPVTFYLGAKDLQYALKIGHEISQPCPLAALCEERFIEGTLKLPG